jgi:glycosyltransferase involved in cell wall biosynthesis
MKILLVYPSPLSNVFFRAYIDRFAASGHDVAVCTAPSAQLSGVFRLPDRTKTFEVDLPRSASVLAHATAIRRLRSVVRAFQPDIVHAHMSAAVFTTAMARRWQQTTIGTFHGLRHPLSNGLFRLAFGFAERAAIRRLDQVQVVNAHDDEIVRRDCPSTQCVLLHAGFGCDLEQFDREKFGPAARLETRRELAFQPDDVVGAFVGRMVAFKGLPTLIRAFRLVSAQESNARLLVIGDRDRLHPTGLKHRDDRWLREADAVRVTGFTRDPERYLNAADYLVMPSAREGLSTAIMEALCMGLPVVTTTARGCADLIENDQNGLLVTPGDERALAAALLQMIRDPEARHRLGRSALALRPQLDRNECVDEMLQIYEALSVSRRSHSLRTAREAALHI